MKMSITKPGKVTLIYICFLLLLIVFSTHSLAEDKQAAGLTFKETHALIEELIVDKLILQNHWHKTDFPQYNHFDDAVWSVTKYSGDECEITYLRKYEISHKAEQKVKMLVGDKPAIFVAYKLAKFHMAQIDTIETRDYGDSRGSIPSIGIRLVGPIQEWQTKDKEPRKADLKKDPVVKKDNAISVLAKDSDRVVEAFQHLQALCEPADDTS